MHKWAGPSFINWRIRGEFVNGDKDTSGLQAAKPTVPYNQFSLLYCWFSSELKAVQAVCARDSTAMFSALRRDVWKTRSLWVLKIKQWPWLVGITQLMDPLHLLHDISGIIMMTIKKIRLSVSQAIKPNGVHLISNS